MRYICICCAECILTVGNLRKKINFLPPALICIDRWGKLLIHFLFHHCFLHEIWSLICFLVLSVRITPLHLCASTWNLVAGAASVP